MDVGNERSTSDVDEEDDLDSIFGSDNEEEGPYKRLKQFIPKKYPEFNPKVDMRNPIFKVGQVYSTATIFRDAVRAHSIKNRMAIKFDKNERKKKLGLFVRMPNALGWCMLHG